MRGRWNDERTVDDEWTMSGDDERTMSGTMIAMNAPAVRIAPQSARIDPSSV